jgi:hypothetical protein
MSKILTKDDIEVINANFDLNLLYENAEHYRAAQVIRNLWKNAPEITDQKIDKSSEEDTNTPQSPSI